MMPNEMVTSSSRLMGRTLISVLLQYMPPLVLLLSFSGLEKEEGDREKENMWKGEKG